MALYTAGFFRTPWILLNCEFQNCFHARQDGRTHSSIHETRAVDASGFVLACVPLRGSLNEITQSQQTYMMTS